MAVAVVAGARPQFIKAAALLPELRRRGTAHLVHTGQHADPRMVEAHFAGLDLPPPAVRLGVRARDRAPRLEEMTRGLADWLAASRVTRVIALGDADSALAAALAGSRAGIPVAHVEAGARSCEPDLPEERNRIAVDDLADLHFCSTAAHARNLPGRPHVEVTGDVMADLLLAREGAIRAKARGGGHALLTLHRAASADDPVALARVLEGVAGAGRRVLFPVHPRTAASLPSLPPGVELLEPLPYLEFLSLVAGAAVVFTDSGGLQKEAYLLGVPCVTLRGATEWGETVEAGWNILVGTDPARIAAAGRHPPRGPSRIPLYGDGRAAARIAERVMSA
ncbi:MAG: UDP-N-acetyl glucosamine 2-epimerase [Planctomycetaceae bacterium]